MRSETSFFNTAIFRNQLLRTWPLWLGYTAIWLFLVPITLLSESSAWQGRYDASDAAYLLLNTGVRGGLFLAFVFGLLFAMLAFSYLTNGRATNGYHTLPVRREALFSTVYLTGLFCQLAGILLTFALGAAAALPFHLSFKAVIGPAMLAAMLETVFYYSFAVLCVMMTGQMLAAPAFYLIGNFLITAMESLVRSFAGNFLFGYASSGSVSLGFLSPLYWMYRKVDVASIETWESDSYYVTAYALEHRSLMILAAYAAAGLVIAVIALLLYRTRKSEMTGSTVAFPWAVPVFKYGVAFCTAIALGQMLYYFLFGQYQTSGHYSLPGTIVCMVGAGLLGYYVAEMLIRKSFRVFRAGAKGAAIVAGVLVLLGIGMTFDLTGYESRVPDADSVESVSYSFGGRTRVATEDPDTIRYLVAAHRAITEHKGEQLLHTARQDTAANRFTLELTYLLHNGTQITRSYQVSLSKDDLADPASVTGRMNTLYMCPESARRRILGPGSDEIGENPCFLDSYCSYFNKDSTVDYSLTPEQAETVYEALLQDAKNVDGSSGNIFTVQEYAINAVTYSFTLYFNTVDEKGRPDVDYLYAEVNENTPHTLETLNELLPELAPATYEIAEDSGDAIDTPDAPDTESVS